MRYLLALLPIAVVLVLMTVWRWGAHKAGLGGWLAAVGIAACSFGLNPQVFWVSQGKGLLLSVFVLAVMWPALFLFHWLNAGGGIGSIAKALQEAIPDSGMCALMMAWALSGVLEGMAGFGIPVAVVSPMLVAAGVPPLRAVAAVGIGHCWAVSFGSMGVIFETLQVITGIGAAELVGWSGLLLAATCLACGLGAAFVLGEQKHWPVIAVLSGVMGAGQYGLAAAGLVPLSCFCAGGLGLGLYVLLVAGHKQQLEPPNVGCYGYRVARGEGASTTLRADPLRGEACKNVRAPLVQSLACYGALALIMGVLTLCGPLRKAAESVSWRASFTQVTTRNGFVTRSESGPAFRLFTHPGALIGIVAVAAVALSFAGGSGRRPRRERPTSNPADESQAAVRRVKQAALATWRSGAFTSVGIISMVGISAMMEHCGMSLLLAQGASRLLGAIYPLASPLVGVLGAFATGSNNNSNIMFGPLQKNVALLLNISPALLVAAQTAGGSLGSLLAPAKLVVGCSTVGLIGQEGLVLRRTMPYGIVIGLGLGVLTLICAASH